MTDIGLTHVAFSVRSLEASVGFYEKYARMACVHRREAGAVRVAWMTDRTRPFVLVLVQGPGREDTPLGPFGHLGVACESPAEVDRLCAIARADGILRKEPTDSGPPVGYWAFVADPDGNTLELSYGQEVGLTVAAAPAA
ncbi:MAG TPA: VOC family protein [Stellaceae bacterium]|jgi:catechol 2,3-dioxygenase-like lactoylglutathione lyase family enzyme